MVKRCTAVVKEEDVDSIEAAQVLHVAVPFSLLIGVRIRPVHQKLYVLLLTVRLLKDKSVLRTVVRAANIDVDAADRDAPLNNDVLLNIEVDAMHSIFVHRPQRGDRRRRDRLVLRVNGRNHQA